MFTLELGGCDIVLGIQWLVTLGPVLSDFEKLLMKFNFKGQGMCLKGLSSSMTRLFDDGEINQFMDGSRKGYCFI